MKKVLNADNVAHVWAYQSQNEARTPNNSFYFYNETIYSYGSHFPIAKHITNSQGQKGILFTTRSYSNTTSKHLHKTWAAIPDKENIIYCHNPHFTVNDNLTVWDREINALYQSLSKAKKPEKYLFELHKLKGTIFKYCTFMGVEIPEAISLKLEITNKAEVFSIIEKEQAIKAEIEARTEKEKQKEINKQLKKFRAFERFNLYSKYSYLRYNETTQRIETSQRIEIPLEAAKRLYKTIKEALKDINNPTQQILQNLKILDYQVKNVQKSFIEIGCHKIEMKEINKLAKTLKF